MCILYACDMHQFSRSCSISMLTRPILSSFSSYSLATSRISIAPLWTYYLVTRPILSGKPSASFRKKSLTQPSWGNLHDFHGLFGAYFGHMSQFWGCFFLYKVGFPWIMPTFNPPWNFLICFLTTSVHINRLEKNHWYQQSQQKAHTKQKSPARLNCICLIPVL